MKELAIEGPSASPWAIKNSPAVTTNRRLFGLATRRERWGPSWRGYIVIGLLMIGIACSLTCAAYPFLAVTHRVNGDALVVEGWVHQYAIRAGIDEFNVNHYERVFTTGGPVEGMGGYTNDYNTSAYQGAARLQAEGLLPDLIQAVPARISDRDRTYSAARALRDWFSEHHATLRAINVVTEDVHARRSRLLFQEAFGRGVRVGVIAVPNPDYDANHWWRYSEGVRDVISEGIAYMYARFFFWPRARIGSSSQLSRSKAKLASSPHV